MVSMMNHDNSSDLDSIVAPKARDRLLELIEREQITGDVRDTFAGALTRDLRCQQLLFQAMLDTWAAQFFFCKSG